MPGRPRRAECRAPLVIPSAVEESRARAAASRGMQGAPCHSARSRGISCPGSYRPSECRAPLVIPSAVEESRARAAASLGMQGAPCHSERSRGISCPGSRVPRNAGRPESFRAQSRNLVPGQPRPSECRAPLVIPSAVEESRARAAASRGMQGAPCHAERSRGISCSGSRVARNAGRPLSFRAQSRNLVLGQPRPALGQPRCDVAGRAAPAVCTALGRGQGDFSTPLRSTRNDREEEALGMTRGQLRSE